MELQRLATQHQERAFSWISVYFERTKQPAVFGESPGKGHRQNFAIGPAVPSWPAVRPVPMRPGGRVAAEWVEAPGCAAVRPSPGALS
jgi:hypothetical protein